jgi:hypothetical protein
MPSSSPYLASKTEKIAASPQTAPNRGSDQLNTRIHIAVIIWPWALLYTADDLMY